MKLVKVKKTSKEIIEDIKNLSLSEKFESAGLIGMTLSLFILAISMIVLAFKYGVVAGIFAILFLGGLYAVVTGLLFDSLEDNIDFYKTEWVEDE